MNPSRASTVHALKVRVGLFADVLVGRQVASTYV